MIQCCATALVLVACSADGGGDSEPAGAPTVIDSMPADGEVGVDAELGEITATFSTVMATEGWSWVTEIGRPAPVVTGLPFYVDDITTVLPVRLEPDTEYAIWINSPDDRELRKFTSADGVSARAHRIRFRTAP
jgi:hypothetical protein